MRLYPLLFVVTLTIAPIMAGASDYYVATTHLNVRTGPGTKYSVSYTLQKGDKVELLSKADAWYEIRFKGKTGFAYFEYLAFSKTVSGSDSFDLGRIVDILLVASYASLALFLLFFLRRNKRSRDISEYVAWRSSKANVKIDSYTEAVRKTNLSLDSGRGTESERDLVKKLARSGMPLNRIFHDLYIEERKGKFCQIDVVVMTDAGIVVVEVKAFSGWIYGSGNQRQWTQSLAHGKDKYRFYNPIMQNEKHIRVLRRKLNQYGEFPFYSVVVFYGDCELKQIEFVPRGAYIAKSERILEVFDTIRKNPPVQYANEDEFILIFQEAVTNGSVERNQKQHVENIRDMLGTDRVFD